MTTTHRPRIADLPTPIIDYARFRGVTVTAGRIAQVFTPGDGWADSTAPLTPTHATITAMARTGATALAVRFPGGRVADFTIRECQAARN